MGALLGNLGEGSYAAGLCVEEVFGMVVSTYRGPIEGSWDGGPLGSLRDWIKGALGTGRLSQKRLNVEGLEGRLLYWVPWVMKGRLWGQASLFMGVQLGNMVLCKPCLWVYCYLHISFVLCCVRYEYLILDMANY